MSTAALGNAYADPASSRPAASDDVIPVLDLGPYRRGEPGAAARLGAELRHACENVGFYFVTDHGVPDDLIRRAFAEAARFHALPEAEKLRIRANEHNVGYLPFKGSTTRSSRVHVNTKPNLNEALFLKRDLTADHPDVVANRRYRGQNQWPDPALIPGFRETVVEYCAATERLALSLLPLYAAALELPADHFDEAFREPMFTLRMTHYPPVPPAAIEDNQFAIAPHTDSGFMTLLPQNELPGLAIRTADGQWIEPPSMPGTYLVNTGDLGRRWTNHRFLSTPHRVVHTAPRDRYAIPFFFDCNIDWVMACLPTCTAPDNPPRHEPTTYTEYMLWFGAQNYGNIQPRDGEKIAKVE